MMVINELSEGEKKYLYERISSLIIDQMNLSGVKKVEESLNKVGSILPGDTIEIVYKIAFDCQDFDLLINEYRNLWKVSFDVVGSCGIELKGED